MLCPRVHLTLTVLIKPDKITINNLTQHFRVKFDETSEGALANTYAFVGPLLRKLGWRSILADRRAVAMGLNTCGCG